MAAKIRKGDNVIVLVGKDKGKKGEVKQVFPKDNKVLVEGVNTVISHQKQTKDSAGGRISKSAPINISNIAIIDPKSSSQSKESQLLSSITNRQTKEPQFARGMIVSKPSPNLDPKHLTRMPPV